MKRALLFPGQGSQRVGMGRELASAFASAREVFERADDALGFRISKLCFEGPEDELVRTEYTQPAILTNSIAVLRALETRGLTFDIVAGHSLGEFSALVAAAALSLEDAVRLVHLRGQAMQRAVPEGEGAMAAVLGLPADALIAVCEQAAQGQACELANLNGGGQIVVSGHASAIDRLLPLAKAAGAKRTVKLAVSAPFHCSLMAPAAKELTQAMASVAVGPLHVPVVANVDASPNLDHERVKALLTQQVISPVRWEDVMLAMAGAGVTNALELGSGSVLRGLGRRIVKELEIVTIGEPHEVEAWSP